ncbi:protocatechuate 3,4-dioxygenase subunit beta [Jannaschia donghaensis]|uniref:Protocatechuate 3,4-dioxygenase beta chain n=1 Tax=Jannaschia donghaensis TaxID=420998 RepID=A0A0M6YNF8_9RHOB|nr:protocatechuate 3,4-dioxygenase subunit beta [Jannaschia donghaensis]CTQ51185.1 Protocatechuate 3,4-dioxygenase beta chain [Jannaschia donghaensis]
MTDVFTGRLTPRADGLHPPPLAPAYRSTALRSPRHAPIRMPSTTTEETGPVFGHDMIAPLDHDLTANFGSGGAIGEQVFVMGHLRDEGGRPIAGALIEVWQANAGGRYRHARDGYLAPLDPGFGGCGRCLTDDAGAYSFRTIRPGAYPWPNGGNDWRPAHIHFSVFGHAFGQRLVTQMYFEGDPHIALCPIVQSIPDPAAIDRLIARLDMGATVPFDARAYRFDITLRGLSATPFGAGA